MIVIVTVNAPPALRGRLSLWLIEVRAGVYVGKYNNRVREMIWQQVTSVQKKHPNYSAVMIFTSACEAGFQIQMIGENRRKPIEIDGMQLIQFLPKSP